MTSSNFHVRPARALDVRAIAAMRLPNEGSGRKLLKLELVSLFEKVPEFLVAVNEAGEVVGAGALHVMWEDLAEVRSLIVRDDLRGQGVGHLLVSKLLERAKSLDVNRVFCLTFETEFFAKHGFQEISDVPVDADTFEELVRSSDDGVAEFLDLARVKENTMGNTRMLVQL
ncbi:MAG: amino-acid N-acetyltransferase [Rhodoluna sp.]|nr:amino-acid N-acetyltransferase [Rhodoluna sp.]